MVWGIQEGAGREDVRDREKEEEGWERGMAGKGEGDENGRKEKRGRKWDQMRSGITEKSGRGERRKRKEGRGWRREKHPRPPSQSKQYWQSHYKIIFFTSSQVKSLGSFIKRSLGTWLHLLSCETAFLFVCVW